MMELPEMEEVQPARSVRARAGMTKRAIRGSREMVGIMLVGERRGGRRERLGGGEMVGVYGKGAGLG
jgi:hypothetical protein